MRLRGRSAAATSTDPLDHTAGLRHRDQPVRDGRALQQHCRGSNLRPADRRASSPQPVLQAKYAASPVASPVSS